jgi:hypothetical protein
VQFADIGAQEVKNIPTPVHAFMVAMRREDGTYSTPQVKKPIKASDHGAPNWMWPVVVTVVCLTAIGVGGFLYFTKLENMAAVQPPIVASNSASPALAPSATPTQVATTAPTPAATPMSTPAPVAAASTVPTPVPTATAPPPSPPPIASGETFAVASVPFIGDRMRTTLEKEYVSATDFKAFSLNLGGFSAFVTGQPSEEAARSLAVEQCQKRAESATSPRKCELYAVGNKVVYAHGKPPVPPLPWIKHDAATERPFASKEVPLLRDPGKSRLETAYVPGRRTKTIAIGPGGQMFFNTNAETMEDSARRNLESCGALAGVPCMIVAADDHLVVPVPTTLRATGFFKAADSPLIAPDARVDLARKLADAPDGWNAIAVGTARRPGLGMKQASEQGAVNEAMNECARRDSDCRVVAIGPFTVGPN